MTLSFGPWSTAIHEHAHAQLAAFWKRRLGSLSLVSDRRSPSCFATSAYLVIAALGVCLPTFLAAPVSAENDADSAEASRDQADSPQSGRLGLVAATEPRNESSAEIERPKLRFLSWKHGRPQNEDEPLEGPYWLPSGERVTDEEQLLPLREVTGWRENLVPGGPRFVSLFVSCPEFRTSGFGEIDLLNADRSVIDKTLLQVSHVSSRVARGEGYPEHLRLGWQYYHVTFGPQFAIPERATIRLRYTAGEGRRVASIAADASVDREVFSGVILRQIGEDEQAHASITLTIERQRGGDFWYDLRAVDLHGRSIHWGGRRTEPGSQFIWTFRQSLDDIDHFELLEWEKQSMEFQDVSLRPLD